MDHLKTTMGQGSSDDDEKATGSDKSTNHVPEGATGSKDSRKMTDKEHLRRLKLQSRFFFRSPGNESDDDSDDFQGMDPIDMHFLLRRVGGHPWGNSFFSMRRHPLQPEYTVEESPYEIKNREQRQWRPPMMEKPDIVECQTSEDHGELETDARLFILREKNDKEERTHSVLHMPSYVPDKLKSGNHVHSSSTFNILMADVSASMMDYWRHLVQGWNDHIAPILVGRTSIYVFGSEVTFKRSGTMLQKDDFDRGSTDLTGALQTIVSEVYGCKERYINVFLITDGHHNVTVVEPDTVISYMQTAKGKKCEVYILGAGSAFPVKYSVDIRSHLHSGSSNLPTLFWAQSPDNVEEQMCAIASEISSGTSQSLKLSVAGSSLPGIDNIDSFHLNEWVYFPCRPDQIKEISLSFGVNKGYITLEPCAMPIADLSALFRQWNSIIIQRHSKKEVIPPDVLPLMEQLFKTQMEELQEICGPPSIRQRLAKKEMTKYETEFRTLFNKIKIILTTEKFQNELELAENILSATVVGGKYNTKAFQMKGHTDRDYEDDCHEFMKVFKKCKENLLDIKVTPEDCCRVTLNSTLSDLKDPDLPEMMKQNKFDFLKHFTITGIPVFAPARDSVTINPWSLSIRAILKEPYTIVSQIALDAAANTNLISEQNQEVHLKPDDCNTRCNAIVPVFPPNACKVIAPLVHTRLFAMCATFAILKNPHIVDFNIHMAALGVTWVRLLFEYPTQPRPEFVRRRIESIQATAALYINRPGFTKYWKVLREETPQALMTESTLQVDNRTLKCESLIKPMFILYLNQRCENLIDPSILAKILRLILTEYIGRCLSNYKVRTSDSTPFTDFFAETLDNQDKKKEWVEKYVAASKAAMEGSENILLEDFYTLERVQKAVKKLAVEEVKSLQEKLTADIPIRVNMKKVEQLRNVSGAGDVSWLTLKTYAKEVGLTEDIVNDLFSEENVFVYVAHALMHRSSRERLKTSVSNYDTIRGLVIKHVKEENSQSLSKDLYNRFISYLQSSWLEAYFAAHKEVVRPMTRQEILREAPLLGVEVTDATFDQVYKRYRPHLGLLGNACQSRACPYFLKPDKSYNQHSSVERHGRVAFPHAFHHAAYQLRDTDLPTVVSQVVSGAYSRNHTTIPQEAVKDIVHDLQNLQKIYRETTLLHR
ncbi:uncharacterized protein [Panulirus ornatus]|uniref:uncharacterized protein n=1 Tax=Panulirus ornatus TaxID=150431 RepID=UPI003A8567EB